MSIHRKKLADGRHVFVVRWREGGRGGKQRSASFDRRSDADYFEATLRRARQLGQPGSEVLGSNQTFEEFVGEWWETHAVPVLAPGTLASYVHPLDRWIVPYLGRLKLRELSRETIDNYRAALVSDGAGAPTVNRCLGILQGILHRAVEWRRISGNPVAGVQRVPHRRSSSIDAKSQRDRSPELFAPVAADLAALLVETPTPEPQGLVFPDTAGRRCGGRAGGSASGSPRSTWRASPTSVRTTCGTRAPRS